ncbi:Phosphatidylinositol glycan anchor biosynthesis class U protein [Actinidia chinensis var. chinensis]|uniref:Phosphatidylinositol glycan anchor biosynthesis class U protein n=1 Tax=Actinidia chinensis var. chinensis TaxID=1590841 RepID=A0A2R6QK57_ACTCC|nr:Phosphatidylinositol glycan anchor biosynthesis class U protein [Actinidia chinensis var. chinensis]
MEEKESEWLKKKPWFWSLAFASVIFRLILILFPNNLNLASRPEVSTPLTSLRRLAEGYWLKQASMSPYAGSMFHGSPLLLSILGPLTVKRFEGQPSHILCSLVSVIADFVTAMFIRSTGLNLQKAYNQSLKSLGLFRLLENSEIVSSGDIAALVYLWNPFTIISCVGLSTSPIENLVVMLCLYGACTQQVPLAAFGWVIATHLSLYPAILIVPVILLLGYGPDTPPRKLLLQRNSCKFGDAQSSDSSFQDKELTNQPVQPIFFSWKPVVYFFLWALMWALYVLVLCGISVKDYGGLREMFNRTYGFILTVEDLSPNIGVLWYFFAEVFDFFRNFFLIVFHLNILFMILPLAIRLKHRPCFLAFVYVAISSMLKSYPSVGDSALCMGLLGLFINELADIKFSFFLFCGYVGVSLLSPVMHNLWIWRGTGNANFYFATGMAFACLQIVLVVESVGAMLNHDRKMRRLSTTNS